MRKLTAVDVIDALWVALTIVQGGIGALVLAEPWNVLVPLGVAAVSGFIGRLAGRESVRRDPRPPE